MTGPHIGKSSTGAVKDRAPVPVESSVVAGVAAAHVGLRAVPPSLPPGGSPHVGRDVAS